jgi:hypothetical protein
MRAYNFNVGLASSCLIISAQALPRLLLPKHEMDGFFKPRDYKVYEQPATINKYTYGGYGPAPTLSYPGSSTSKTTSEVPEQTSSLIFSSTCKIAFFCFPSLKTDAFLSFFFRTNCLLHIIVEVCRASCSLAIWNSLYPSTQFIAAN